MNKLLSDDSLNQSDINDSKTSVSDDKPKGSVVIYGKSGRIVTLPPIEIPKTRSLVKKEVCNLLIMKIKLYFLIFEYFSLESRCEYKRTRQTKTFIRKVSPNKIIVECI